MAWYSGLLAAMFGKGVVGEMTEIRQTKKDRAEKRRLANAEATSSGGTLKKWRWEGHTVYAHTKSEARGLLKRNLKLQRLPVGAVVSRLE